MRMFRLLRADEIECRQAEVGKDGTYISLLLYKTARTDSALLDETVGPYNWDNDYREISGKMYCGIGLYDTERQQWVWKWNVGTESNQEAEKGEASDAMKRAGFVWGLGAELYSAPRITIWNNKCKIEKNSKGFWVCRDKFDVKEIEYDERENISYLEIANVKTGAIVFTWGKQKSRKEERPNPPAAPTPAPKGKDGGMTSQTGASLGNFSARSSSPDGDDVPFLFTDADAPPEKKEPEIACADCGKIITGRGKFSAEDMAKRTVNAFGYPLCYECGIARQKKINAENAGRENNGT